MSSLENRIFVCIIVDKRGAGLSAYTFPITNSRCGREVMQMSVFLALVQTFVAAASLGVALLALERVDPPPGGAHCNTLTAIPLRHHPSEHSAESLFILFPESYK